MKIRHANKFLLGFEVEMIFDQDSISYDSLVKRFLKLNPNITHSEDGSIDSEGEFFNPNFIEIKTPPLPVNESFKLLRNIFKLIDKYGATNNTTGFHINVSPVSDKIYYALNPFRLIDSSLWQTILKDFKREKNDYCYNFHGSLKGISSSPLSAFHKINNFFVSNKQGMAGRRKHDGKGLLNKYNAISFRNYGLNRNPSSRVEIRAMGGKDYHKKYNLILKHTENVLTEFVKSCNI